MSKRKKALSLSEEMRTAIRDSKLSPYEVSEQSGVDRAVLSRFINGKRTITLDTADKLAEVLKLRIIGR